MPYIGAAGLQAAEEAGGEMASNSDWDKGTKREVREENQRKCTVNARREILMHSCISEAIVNRAASMFELMTLRSADRRVIEDLTNFLKKAKVPSTGRAKAEQKTSGNQVTLEAYS